MFMKYQSKTINLFYIAIRSTTVILLYAIQKVAIKYKLFSNFECDFHSYQFLGKTINIISRSNGYIDQLIGSSPMWV